MEERRKGRGGSFMLLISACLLGVNCKYDGGNNLLKGIRDLTKKTNLLPVCPEQLGGLPTPRPPAQIREEFLLSKEALVFNGKGMDVTEEFQRGAKETLKLAKSFSVEAAILKDRSPSCGSTQLGRNIKGKGVTAALLEEEGIRVFPETDWDELRRLPYPSSHKNLYLGVIGAAEADEEIWDLAYRTGRSIGKNRAILLCGGRGGVMEAAAKGALHEGGMTVGILPGLSKGGGNQYLSISLATGLGDARNAIITRAADGLIAIGGAYGTLSEIGLALKMGKRVVGLKTWKMVDYKGGEAKIATASSPHEAVALLLNLIDHRSS